MKRVLTIFISALCSPLALFSQSDMLPVRVDQFYNNYFLINPASIGIQSDIEFTAGEKTLTGDFEGINTTYANANVSLYDHQRPAPLKHVIGIKFINDKEGQYIGRNWASLMYALRIPIRNSLTLTAGAAAGFANIYYKGSNVSSGGSDFAPNVDVGIWIKNKRLNLGLAIDQVAEAKLRPLDQQYTLRKGWYATGDYTFGLNRNFSLKPAVMYRYAGADYTDLDFALIAEIQRVFILAGTFRYERGFSGAFGITNLPVLKNKIRILASYYSPLTSGTTLNTHTVELTLNYFISSKKKTDQPTDEETTF